MSKEKQTQDALLEAIDIAVENKLKKLGFNYYVDGVIKGKNIDNTYNVLINGEIYNNVPSKNNFEYSVNDVVQVLIKNGNWNKKFIDDKKQHNEIPQNILNLEQDISNIQSTYLNMGKRTRIKANEDFNDYTEIGNYCVLTDSDAMKIANIPIRTCGILNVYSSNGDDINNTQYKYLVQEYTILTGNYKYIRHIRQTPNILADVTKYPDGWEFKEWIKDIRSYDLYPLGCVYITSNGVSPDSPTDITWDLIDKSFKSLSVKNDNTTKYFSRHQTNTSSANISISREGHMISTRIVFVNSVVLNDTEVEIGQINLDNIGVDGSILDNNIVGYCDAGNAVLMCRLDISGKLYVSDIVSKTGASEIPTGKTCVVTFLNIINTDNMLDSACDKFYWGKHYM